MTLTLVRIVGFAAAMCTTGAYIPQLLKTWRTRSAVDISLQMFAIMTPGTVLWFLYGIWLRDWPIIGANTVSLALTSAILVLKLRHG
jgi:MtN3 and saliva related transmembrane protein